MAGAQTPAGVVTVGSVNLDRVLTVPQLPLPGETVIATAQTLLLGGKGANQALNAAALTSGVALVGAIGADQAGADARAALDAAGVDCSYLLVHEAPTGSASIYVDGAGENTIVITAGANALLTPDAVRAAVSELASETSVVVASLEVSLAAVEAAAEAAAAANARFVLNPAPARRLSRELLRGCDVLVPNAGEFARLAESAAELFDAGVGAVVVTRGSAGAELFEPESEPVVIPAPQVDVVDTTGAGDAFVGALAATLREGLALDEAARLATAAGAIATTAVGAQGAIPTRARIAQLLGRAGHESPADYAIGGRGPSPGGRS
jgi:ribokinase